MMSGYPQYSHRVACHLPSVADTERFATALAACLMAPMVITLSGEIGAGKTTLLRFMLRAMGVNGHIKSPSFSLVESYELETKEIHHFDLYRIAAETELEWIGFRDYFQPNALCCIEWPERSAFVRQHADLAVFLGFAGAGRTLEMMAEPRVAMHIRQIIYPCVFTEV